MTAGAGPFVDDVMVVSARENAYVHVMAPRRPSHAGACSFEDNFAMPLSAVTAAFSPRIALPERHFHAVRLRHDEVIRVST
ncbi:hypothetical protein, partial [Nocardia gipuzkoensis]|uniref:hypothetical protein n=1 Tax=Nocardia gipuzkoensis TaxID=2749991 RepID=UPI00237E7576